MVFSKDGLSHAFGELCREHNSTREYLFLQIDDLWKQIAEFEEGEAIIWSKYHKVDPLLTEARAQERMKAYQNIFETFLRDKL